MSGAREFIARNKLLLGLGGATAVAGLALLRSRKGTTSSGGSTDASGTQGVNATGGAGYDSSASDVYNALQPGIEKASNQYDALMSWLQSNGVPTPGAGSTVSTGSGASSDLTHADPAPLPTPVPTLTGITTSYGSTTGSIYNAGLSNGSSIPINQNDVWSGAYSTPYGTSVGNLPAAQADQVRDALASKGLGYGRAGNTGGGYTEETAGGRVQQALGSLGR